MEETKKTEEKVEETKKPESNGNPLLNVGIGEKEMEGLKPEKVAICGVSIEPIVKDSKEIGKKATLLCKHPAKEEPIKISQVKYVKKNKIETSGLWVNLDDDKKLRKGSAIVSLMNYLQVGTLNELVGKEIQTDLDDNGYLCFKIY